MTVLELVRSDLDGANLAPANSLRVELRAAIERLGAANARHRIAKEVATRAEFEKNAAADAVNRLKQRRDTAQTDATHQHARRLSEALRAGSTLPTPPDLPAADSAPLAAAVAHLSALQQSTCELETEEQAARAKVAAAAADVSRITEDIIDGEGRELAAEVVVRTIQAHWAALDRLTGLLRIDERREAPRLRGLQTEVVQQIDRRKLAISNNPLMIELHNWRDHLEGISADAERIWQNYRARLRLDADAQLDVE